jgi:hypothetical protein
MPGCFAHPDPKAKAAVPGPEVVLPHRILVTEAFGRMTAAIMSKKQLNRSKPCLILPPQ